MNAPGHAVPPSQHDRHFLHALVGCMADRNWVIPWQRLFAAPSQRLAVVDMRGLVTFATIRLMREVGRARMRGAADDGLRALLPPPMAAELTAIIRRCVADDRPAFVHGLMNGRRACAAILPLNRHGGPGSVLLAVGDSCFWPAGTALPAVFRRHTLGYGSLGDLAELSVRELDLFRMLGRGITLSAAAKSLGCPLRHAQRLARALRARIGARNNFHAAIASIERGLPEFSAAEWDQLVFVRPESPVLANAASS